MALSPARRRSDDLRHRHRIGTLSQVDAPSRQGQPISKGYDADELVKWIQQTGALVVISPRLTRTVLRDYDNALYKEFNLLERMCSRCDQVKPGCVQRRDPKALVNMTAENNPNIMRPISIETTHSPSRPGTRKTTAVLYRR